VTENENERTPWWGKFEIPEGKGGRWRVGPLAMWVHHGPKEWRVAHKRENDPLDQQLEWACPTEPEDPPEKAEVARFTTERGGSGLVLALALADRPVVARPETPFNLLAGDRITFFVSTPVWVRIQTGDPPEELMEIPVYRPSDTWFGASPAEGELCYASKTSARLSLQNVPFRPFRAVTTVTLRNKGEDRLVLERINLPVPHLALFRDADGLLWTNTVTVVRETHRGLADVRFEKGPPDHVKGPQKLCEPRLESKRNIVFRALGAMLT
jgi:hypothetical protein